MSNQRPGRERRQFTRISFRRPAQLTVRGVESTVEVVDLSLKGSLLEVPAELRAEVGAPCALVVLLDSDEAAIRLDGEVARRLGTSLGIRCNSMDLESIGHLRRMVELNLGDEELLDRELGALIGLQG